MRTFVPQADLSASRADRFLSQTARLSGRTFPTITCGPIHDVRRPIKCTGTPHSSDPMSEYFLVTRTTSANPYRRLQTFHCTIGLILLFRERTVFYHTLTSARRERAPSSFARTTLSRTHAICILEDARGNFRVSFVSRVDLSLHKRTFFVPADLFTSYLL